MGGPKVLAESSLTTIDNNIIKYYVGRITDYEYINEIPLNIISNIKKDGTLDINIVTQCLLVGESMCDFQQQISINDILIAKANILVVSVNGNTGTSASFPMSIRKLFEIAKV